VTPPERVSAFLADLKRLGDRHGIGLKADHLTFVVYDRADPDKVLQEIRCQAEAEGAQ
jgi:hypothetical protein